MENEIVGRIVRALNIALFTAEGRRSEREQASNPDARDYTMRGWGLLLRTDTRESEDEAQRLFEHALALDERAVDALIGAANALTSRVINEWSERPAEDIERADALLDRALALAPERPAAHHTKGHVFRWRKRWNEAIAKYETAIALDRNFVWAYRALGQCKTYTGYPDEAVPLYRYAMRLSPRDPSLPFVQGSLGLALLLLGQNDEATGWLEKAVLGSPLSIYHRFLAAAYALKGDEASARRSLAEAIKIKPTTNTIARVRETAPSAEPKFLALWERYLDGLRRAGMPEE